MKRTSKYYNNNKTKKDIHNPKKHLIETLKKLISYAYAYVGEKFDGVVLTVPAYYSSEQKNKILEAAKLADLEVLQLICEPTAAAIAYGMEHSYINGETLFVFDMGGGTFDITIIKILNSKDFTVMALGGDSHLGGRDFDGVIIKWMLLQLKEQVGKVELTKRKKHKMNEMAKEAKEALSQAEDAVLQLSELHSDAVDVTLTRSEFEELSNELMIKIKECIGSTLKCRQLNQQEINHVLFVGSASKMPMISKLLKEFFNEAKFSKTVNAEEIVTLGAMKLAVELGKKSADASGSPKHDIKSLMIGIEIFVKGETRFRKVFDNTSKHGRKKIVTVVTTEDNQKKCEIPLYEGFSNDISRNSYIGSIFIDNLPPGKAGKVKVNVQLKIDKNGILTVIRKNNFTVQYKTHLKASMHNESENEAENDDYELDYDEIEVESDDIDGGKYRTKVENDEIEALAWSYDIKNERIYAGIDFSTSHSCIAVFKHGKIKVLAGKDGTRIMPMCSYFGKKNEIIVGKKAKICGQIHPEELSFGLSQLFSIEDSAQVKQLEWSTQIVSDENIELSKYTANDDDNKIVLADRSLVTSLYKKEDDPFETSFKNFEMKISEESGAEISDSAKTVFAEILKQLTSYVGEGIDGVVIAVPAYFSSLQKCNILQAAEMANLNVLKFVHEPIAAMIGYGIEQTFTKNQIFVVFNLDYETLDITVIKYFNDREINVIGFGGYSRFGGKTFSFVIIQWILNEIENQVGKMEFSLIEKAKIIKMADEANDCLCCYENARLQLSKLHNDAKEVILTRAKFEELSKELLEKIKQCIISTLDSIRKQKISHVLLIGGASKMPIIVKCLKELFVYAKFSNPLNAEEIVAIGATLLAANFGKQFTRSEDKVPDNVFCYDFFYKKNKEVFARNVEKRNPLMIGVEILEDDILKFEKIFDSNSPWNDIKKITVKRTENFQRDFKINFYEGYSSNIECNQHIGSLKLNDFLENDKAEKNSLDIISIIDENGLFKAVVKYSCAEDKTDYKIFFKKIELSRNPSNPNPFPPQKFIQKHFDYDETINAVGVDLGNSTCYIAINRPIGIESISLENNGKRELLSYVSYDEKQPKCGKIVVTRMERNAKSSVYDMKIFAGKNFGDILIKQTWPFEIIKNNTRSNVLVENKNGTLLTKNPEDVLADLIKHIKQKINYEERKLNKIVFAVPWNFDESQKEAIKAAASIAGWKNVHLLSNPFGAFYAYSVNDPILNNCTAFTFDLGGSSLELCIFKVENGRVNILTSYCNTNIGGKNFDNVLKECIKQRLREKQIELKWESKHHALNLTFQHIKKAFEHMDEFEYLYDDEACSTVSVTQDDFEISSKKLLTQIQGYIKTTLDKCVSNNKDFIPNQIDKVLLVGGGCRMQMIKKLLKKEFPNAELCCDRNPEEIIAVGAAIYAKNLI